MNQETKSAVLNTVCNSDLDELILEIMSLVKSGKITTLPQTLDESYSNLGAIMSVEDINQIHNLLDARKYSAYEENVLNAIAQWNLRNTSSYLKAIIGAICYTLHSSRRLSPLPTTTEILAVKTGMPSDVTRSLHMETPETIRRLIKAAVGNGPVEAKIPVNGYSDEIAALMKIDSRDPVEVENLRRYLGSTDTKTVLKASNMERKEYIARLLIQTTKTVSEYKNEDSFSTLRSFLNNAGHICTLIRLFSIEADNYQWVSKLACDVNDQIHSLDRLLSANAVLARQMLTRMIQNKEVIYRDLMDLTRHQHRILAIEAAGVFTMFSYLFKSMEFDFIAQNEELNKSITRMLRYTEIATKYTNEISVKLES